MSSAGSPPQGCIFDHPTIGERYFFPRPDRAPDVLEVDCGAATLACCYHQALPDAPTVIFFHGNGEVVADYCPWLAHELTARRCNLLISEYRGYGSSTGSPAMVGMLADVEAVFEAAGVPAEKVIVFGRSVGSLYALELAARQPTIAGLIIESGIADPLERVLMRVHPEEIGTTRRELTTAAKQHLDHRQKLIAYGGPLLVLHARGDSLVDAHNGEQLAAWSTAADTQLVLLPKGDHNTVMMANRDTYWREIENFLDRIAPSP